MAATLFSAGITATFLLDGPDAARPSGLHPTAAFKNSV
jgi:hypothetical protein